MGYIFFAGPDRMGPRAITVLVGLHEAGKEVSTRELAEAMGCKDLGSARRRGAVASISQALHKLEERGLVACDQDTRTIEKNDCTKQTRSTNVWSLTEDGHVEADGLCAAVKILSKTKTGLALIRGTVF